MVGSSSETSRAQTSNAGPNIIKFKLFFFFPLCLSTVKLSVSCYLEFLWKYQSKSILYVIYECLNVTEMIQLGLFLFPRQFRTASLICTDIVTAFYSACTSHDTSPGLLLVQYKYWKCNKFHQMKLSNMSCLQ